MRIPESLEALIDHGVVEDVIRPLMSGKEAQVYLVVSGGEPRVAKIYKEAQNRTFKNRAEYTEGRKTRNSRDQRAMAKRSRHGRAQDEAAWRSTEVDMIYRLRDAGVRVPEPHHFIDGVLIMELVQTAEGHPAPRLGELTLPVDEAKAVFDQLLREVVRMLCAGVVHGDLSEFNVLMAADGPVIIDFPQAVDASGNRNARKLLVRDVENLYTFVERFGPMRGPRQYAQEMWELYESGELTPTTQLTGKFAASTAHVDTHAVVSLIEDANFDERRRREAVGRATGAPGAGGGRRKRGGPAVETVSRSPRDDASPEQEGDARRHPDSPRGPRADGGFAGGAPRDGNRAPRSGGFARDGGRAPRDGGAARDGNRAPRDGAPSRDSHRGPRDGGFARDGNRAPRDGGFARDGNRPPRDGGAPRDGNRAPRDSGFGRDGNRAPRDSGFARDGNRPPRDGGAPRDGNRAPRDGGFARDGNRAPRDGQREGGGLPRDGAPREGGRFGPRGQREGNSSARDGQRPPSEGRGRRDSGRAPRNGPPAQSEPRSRDAAPRDGDRRGPPGDRGPRPQGDRSGGHKPPRRR